MTDSDTSPEVARLDADQDDCEALDEGDDDVRTMYRCECGEHVPSMDAFVDHVSVEHTALDIAVKALLDAEVEVSVTN